MMRIFSISIEWTHADNKLKVYFYLVKIIMFRYILLLVNIFGSGLAQNASFSIQPEDLTVTNGESSLIRCTIENLPLTYYVQWAFSSPSDRLSPELTGYRVLGNSDFDKNKTEIKNVYWSGDTSIGQYFLLIKNISWKIYGGRMYECQVAGIQRLRSKAATLTVKVPPKSLEIFPWSANGVIQASNEEVVELTCSTSFMYPAIKWMQWAVDGHVKKKFITPCIRTNIVNQNGQHLCNSSSTFTYRVPNNTKTKIECLAHFDDNITLSTSYLVTSQTHPKQKLNVIRTASEHGVALYVAIGSGFGAIMLCIAAFFLYRRCAPIVGTERRDIEVKLSDGNSFDHGYQPTARSNDYISMSPYATRTTDLSKQSARSRSSHTCSYHESSSHAGSDHIHVVPPPIVEDYNYNLKNAGYGIYTSRVNESGSNRSHSVPSCSGACCRSHQSTVHGMPHMHFPPAPIPSPCSCDISENLPPIPPPMMPIYTGNYGSVSRRANVTQYVPVTTNCDVPPMPTPEDYENLSDRIVDDEGKGGTLV